jgi:glucokinase
MNVIGIDIGGTRIKAVAMDTQGNILFHSYQPTQDGDDTVWKKNIADAVAAVKQKLDSNDVLIGISAPGLPDEKNECIAFMPGRLQGLEDFHWGNFLEHPAYVINDAVSALMAEAKLGACKTNKHAVMLTLGTGVGGAILIDGKPYQGAFNKAGHMGHMVINDEGDVDVTGMPGSLEECMGNCTIEKRSKGKFQSTQDLLEAYRKGDEFAKSVWLKSIKQLGIGIASITNILSPEIVVLGGGITEAGDDLFQPLSFFMGKYEWRAGGNKTTIAKALHGDLAGAIGAACFALEKNK